MNSSVQYAECLVKKYYTVRERALLISKTVSLCLAAVLVTAVIGIFGIPILPLIPIDIVLFWFFIHRYRAKIGTEYEYRIADGEMTVDRIILKSRRKEVITFDLSNCDTIAPYRDKYRNSADRVEYDHIVDVSGTPLSENLYFALIIDQSGNCEKTLLFFEPTERFLRSVYFHNRRTVMTEIKTDAEEDTFE